MVSDKDLRDQLKMAYLDKLADDKLLTPLNFIRVSLNVEELVDNLVSIEDEAGNVTFYGIDGVHGDPNNIAAVYGSEPVHTFSRKYFGDDEE